MAGLVPAIHVGSLRSVRRANSRPSMKGGWVYIMTNRPNGTLYVGVTSDLAKRVWQHKTKAEPGFTAKHGVDRLVWFEPYDEPEPAIRREKQIKEWKRDWKIELIEQGNPHWLDSYREPSP